MGSGVLTPICNFDHATIYCKANFWYKRDKPFTRNIWHYNNADLPGLCDALDANTWHFDRFSVDHAADYFKNNLLDIARTYIPNRIVKIRPQDKP